MSIKGLESALRMDLEAAVLKIELQMREAKDDVNLKNKEISERVTRTNTT